MHQTRLPRLRLITLAVLTVWATSGYAVGLGPMHVQSALGQPLRASVTLLGADEDLDARCVKVRLESSDGVFIGAAQIDITRTPQVTNIVLSSRNDINEPAVVAGVEVGCVSPVRREYQILLDPPTILPSVNESSSAKRQSNERSSAHVGNMTSLQRQTRPDENESSTAGRRARIKRSLVKPIDSRQGEPEQIAQPKHAAKLAKKIGHDVLKLSRDEHSTASELRLSNQLSLPIADVDPKKIEELRAAQQRFAAILRGEDEVQSAAALVRETIAHAQKMQQEAQNEKVAEITRLKKNDQAALDKVRKNSYSWIAAFAGALFFALAAIAWLLSRLRETAGTSQTNWWEHTRSSKKSALGESEFVTGPSELGGMNSTSGMLHSVAPSAYVVEETPATIDRNSHQHFQHSRSSAAPGTLTSLENSSFSILGTTPAKAVSLSVEEISDVAQEAEFWLSLHEPQRALDILEPQSHVEHPDSPVPWLFLLDIYRSMKNREKFDALLARFERIFNAHIPSFDEDIYQKYQNSMQSLEDYPHLVTQICDLWNDHDIIVLLEGLLVDNRDGARTGFDLPVYRDILLLISIARELHRNELANIKKPVKAKQLPVTKNNEPLVAPVPATAPVDDEPVTVIPTRRPQSSMAAIPQSRIVSASALRSNAASVVPPDASSVAPKRMLPQEAVITDEEEQEHSGLFGRVHRLVKFLSGMVWREPAEQPPNSGIFGESHLKDDFAFSSDSLNAETYTSVFNSNFFPSGFQWQANEVDPVAEADVYIAYGRDAQAEEILKDALKQQPGRHLVIVKLLEIYATRKDKRSFELLAMRLYRETKGSGEEWTQAVEMGVGFDPKNPLYSGLQLKEENIPSMLVQNTPAAESDVGVSLDDAEVIDIFAADSIPDEVSFIMPAIDNSALDNAHPQIVDDLEDLLLADTLVLDPMPEISLQEHNTTAKIERDPWGADSEKSRMNAESLRPDPLVDAPIDIKLNLTALDPSQQHLKQIVAPTLVAAADKYLPEFLRRQPESVPVEVQQDSVSPSVQKEIPAPSTNVRTNSETDILSDLDGDATSHASEMEIKLSLVSAYQEIGDKEGARELIEEIVEGGSPEQIAAAKLLRIKLQ